jgi:alpha-tubulin suppressor-like RCC1 family protein
LVLTEDNKAYFKGVSKDFSFPEDRGESDFKEFKISADPLFSDKIVDLAAGRNFNCFVTESGLLYAMGNRLLKRFGMESETPILIPMKD